jgi:hypothetical protein
MNKRLIRSGIIVVIVVVIGVLLLLKTEGYLAVIGLGIIIGGVIGCVGVAIAVFAAKLKQK